MGIQFFRPHAPDVAPAAPTVQKVQGSYIGDGTQPRVISVGFTPDLVMISPATIGSAILCIHRSEADAYQGMRGSGSTTTPTAGIVISATGFTLGQTSANSSGSTFYYTAFKFTS